MYLNKNRFDLRLNSDKWFLLDSNNCDKSCVLDMNLYRIMEVFEPKRVNSILNITEVNSLRLGGLHI